MIIVVAAEDVVVAMVVDEETTAILAWQLRAVIKENVSQLRAVI
jgi:hypothetical protein